MGALDGAFGASVGSSADASTNYAVTETNETVKNYNADTDSNLITSESENTTIMYQNSDADSFGALLDTANKLFDSQMTFTNLMGQDVIAASIQSQETAIDQVSEAYAVSDEKLDVNKTILLIAFLAGAGIYFKMR